MNDLRTDLTMPEPLVLRSPVPTHSYPGFSPVPVDVAAGADNSLLCTWSDGFERKMWEDPPARNGYAVRHVPTMTSERPEFITRHDPTGAIIRQWEVTTTLVLPHYVELADGRLLAYSADHPRGPDSVVSNAIVYDPDGSLFTAGRIVTEGLVDLRRRASGGIIAAYDRYFEISDGPVLGLAVYSDSLDSMSGMSASGGFAPSRLTIAGDDVCFFDSQSRLVMDSRTSRPIWPKIEGAPRWVLHDPDSSRIGLVDVLEKEDGSSVLVATMGAVGVGGTMTRRSAVRIALPGVLDAGVIVDCTIDAIHLIHGNRWSSVGLDELLPASERPC